eukprot:3234290-Amphidinium_carterae.2
MAHISFWEHHCAKDPKHISDETGCCGDNDPVDVIEIGTQSCDEPMVVPHAEDSSTSVLLVVQVAT